MSRSLLHRTKIDEFKVYLSDKGIEFRDGRGDYQVIQVLIGKDWMCVYDRNKGDHFTVDTRMEGLVRRFINAETGKKVGLIEKVIVSNGCHDCPFVPLHYHNDRFCTLKPEGKFPIKIEKYWENGERHPDCPLLTHTIKVVKVGEKPANKWSDEDMLNAFYASATNEISCEPLTAEQWLRQYKKVKNG